VDDRPTNHSTDGADTADTASATDNSVGDMAIGEKVVSEGSISL